MASMSRQLDGSLWRATAGEPPASTPFEADRHYDAAVVGGGVAGATAALTLAAGGASVALLEADLAGSGATGRSAGFIVPAFAKTSPRQVIERLGDSGERLVELVAGSADFVFSLIRELEIDCNANQNGWFQPARSASAMARVEANARSYLQHGVNGTLLDATETEHVTGTQGYRGCWRADSGGTLHPVRFVHGLVSRAIERGIAYFPETPAGGMSRDGSRWKIATSRGPVRADTVLVCTNAQSPGVDRSLYRSVVPLQVCQFATRPLPEREREHLLQQGQCLTDTRVNLFSYRFDAEGRLITGAIPALPVRHGRWISRRIARRLQRELSLATCPAVEFVWSGTASVASDMLPHIYALGPGAHAITSCNGRGLAISTVLGQALARAILTGTESALPFPPQRPRPLPDRQLRILGTRLYPIYGLIKDYLDH